MKKTLVYDGYFKVFEVDTDDGQRMCIETTDSVNVLLVELEARRVILTRQARVNMISPENPFGVTTETVAGRFDVALSPKALAVKEASEEAGAEITEEQVILVNDGIPMSLSAGAITERAYLAVVFLKPGQLESEERVFGVDAGEHIRRVFLNFDELEDYVCDDVRVFALIQYLLRWLEKNN